MSAPDLPLINPGQRMTIAGRTGSGKSTLGKWMIQRSPGHWLILNPKATAAYDRLPDSNTVHGFDAKKIEKSLEEHKFTNVIPSTQEATPDYMDAWVMYLHETYLHVGLCIDELYSIHQNGRAGQGLLAWLTRGREKKQSFLGLTQRPAFVSKFVFSEADYIVGMSIALEDDRKRMYEFTSRQAFREKLPPHEWAYYDVSADSLRRFGPVPR